MKKNGIWLAMLLVLSVYWNSCSITKRYHNRGFHIEFGHKSDYAVKSKSRRAILVSPPSIKQVISVAESEDLSKDEDLEVLFYPDEIRQQQRNKTEAENFTEAEKVNKLISKKTYLKSQKQFQSSAGAGVGMLISSLLCGIAALLFYLLGYLMINAAGAGCAGVLLGSFFYILAVAIGGVAGVLLIIGLILMAVKSGKAE